MRIACGSVVLAWLAVLSACDIRHRRLPNLLTLPGAFVLLVGAGWAGRGVPALLGAATLTALYLAVHFLAPAAMGAGDVKLAIGLGALTGCFGADVWFFAALAAPLCTVVIAAAVGLRTLAHGPSMCLASALAVGLALL
ncbi:prepilin peptidase [Mycobacterium vicinigordonae]|uniref:Prepilin peptidase n=1 Tax=Mycobacterium vicinigordonae TaxID=1719132 RepID=A0A7D6E885_9MYCO|nr:A24 family peptidase [Mycobacterium vicinigordonae]QLL09482.1 prepilin peptidase [Mycobacterium vicinigordonae]